MIREPVEIFFSTPSGDKDNLFRQMFKESKMSADRGIIRCEADDPTMPAEPIPDDVPTFNGQWADRGLIDLRQFPFEGYASLKCGGTEILIGYSTLSRAELRNDAAGASFRALGQMQRAIYAIASEAAKGRTP